jgi:hypothetical protein
MAIDIKDIEFGSQVEMTWKTNRLFIVVGIRSGHEENSDSIVIINENGRYFTKEDLENGKFQKHFKIGLDYLPNKLWIDSAARILSLYPASAPYNGQTIITGDDNYIFPPFTAPKKKKKKGFEWL